MRAHKKRILYCFAGNSVFGYRDIEMLQNKNNVSVAHFDLMPSFLLKAWSYLKYNFDVIRKIFFIDTVIVNFGSWHTIFPVFLSKVIGKKSIIILGGFDAGNIPSLQYGVFHKPSMLQWFMRRTYTAATYLCPVSEALVSSINRYADPSGVGYKIGLLHHMPEVSDKIRVIPTDFDHYFWNIDEKIERKGILALAYVYHEQTFILKGFDLLIECAKVMPTETFTFAGFSKSMIEKYKDYLPENVTLLSFQSKEQAMHLFQSHKLYLMPSLTESFGQTLCESMLCGCIPIVSNVGVLPKIVGNQGFVLSEKNADQLLSLISTALSSNLEPKNIRDKVVIRFSQGQRISFLNDLIN